MSTALRLLIVEDSENDALLLVRELERGGYDVQFERVDTADAMSAALTKEIWGLVIADYTMPQFRGTDALELLKKSGLDIPFIFLSGTIGEDTAVASMKAGAHDYIIKGNLKRLVPAVERELREVEVRRERRRAEEETQRNLERIRALHEIDVAITSTLDLQSVFNILLDKIDILLPNSATAIRLINRKTGELERAASRNIDEAAYGSQRLKTNFAFTSKSIRDRAPVFIANALIDPRISDHEFFRERELVSYLLVPLIAKEEVAGVLSFFSKGREFTEDETEFAQTLAGQGAIAIHNARLYEEMAKSNAVKDDFLSIMSHELRTPLNVVMGYTAMIKDGLFGEVNPQQEAALQKVSDQANDQLAMINNVLYATVLQVQKPGVDAQEMSPADFLSQLRSDYDTRLHPEGLTLRWEYADDLPLIRADGAKLRVILQNLIGNAIKFTGKGVITISAGVSEGGKSGRWVEFKVADTGIGISKEQLSFIFEKFHQVDSSQTRSYGGVGMGLYIVKSFTELLGGTIEVESEPGKGSTFTMRIPAEDSLS